MGLHVLMFLCSLYDLGTSNEICNTYKLEKFYETTMHIFFHSSILSQHVWAPFKKGRENGDKWSLKWTFDICITILWV